MIRSLEKTDLVVIGAGPAGLAAATEASRKKASVVVLDEGLAPGGRLPSEIHQEPGGFFNGSRTWSNGPKKAEKLLEETRCSGVQILSGASVWGVLPGWFVGLTPADPSRDDGEFPLGFKSRAVLIATGAAHNALTLPSWTLPGVITVGAAQTLINVHQVLPGRSAAVIGIDPLSLSVAQLMEAVGVKVRGVLLPPPNGLQFGPTVPRAGIEALSRFSRYAPNMRLALLAMLGRYFSEIGAYLFPNEGVKVGRVPLFLRKVALAIGGENHVEYVKVAGLRADGTVDKKSEEEWKVDVVVTSAGIYPLVELIQVAGCPLAHVAELGGWVPVHSERMETPASGIFIAGSVTGIEGASVAEAQGRVAGITAAVYLGLSKWAALERESAMYLRAVSAARREAFPFLPNVRVGRRYMVRLWRKYTN